MAAGILLALGELAFQPHPNHRFILDLIARLEEDDHSDSSGCAVQKFLGTD